MQHFDTLADFKAQVGQPLGSSSWVHITQEMINDFAHATGDHQWIHVDIEKAAMFSPFKTTIAHGFLTLSLAPKLVEEIYSVNSVKMGVNYGANKIRFTAPVPSGSKVRLTASLKEVREQQPNGIQATVECVFEIEGAQKPACIAEWLMLMFE
jgi:acyl dehydratase